MKGIRTLLRSSVPYTTNSCHHRNAIRAYTIANDAFRLEGKRNSTKAWKEVPKGSALRNTSDWHSQSFSTSSTIANIEGEENTPAQQVDHVAQWPRLTNSGTSRKTCRRFHEQFSGIARGDTALADELVCGRIWGFRLLGNKLAFVDLMQDGVKLQTLCNFQDLEPRGVLLQDYMNWIHRLKRGDVISVKGRPHRTHRNELSIVASEIPLTLSPCIQTLPTKLENEQVRRQLPHVDLLIRPRAAQILRLGSSIKNFLRMYLEREGHLSVKTPILAAAAGGAIAKPFTIDSKNRTMALRIAPELWLKRLIIGGFERIYEIGPCFRNEGSFPNTSTAPQRLMSIRI